MTKSFDEWLKANPDMEGKYGEIYMTGAERGYEAGQQSKQAEVDALQKRIDEALGSYLKVGIVGLNSACIRELREILKGNNNA